MIYLKLIAIAQIKISIENLKYIYNISNKVFIQQA